MECLGPVLFRLSNEAQVNHPSFINKFPFHSTSFVSFEYFFCVLIVGVVAFLIIKVIDQYSSSWINIMKETKIYPSSNPEITTLNVDL